GEFDALLEDELAAGGVTIARLKGLAASKLTHPPGSGGDGGRGRPRGPGERGRYSDDALIGIILKLKKRKPRCVFVGHLEPSLCLTLFVSAGGFKTANAH